MALETGSVITSMSSNGLPKFKKPPVIETVLGVQFEPLRGLRNAHLGAFWKSLGSGWPRVNDMPPIEQVFEAFREMWVPPAGAFKLTNDPSTRLQIRNEADDRMIQVQNGRLHYNWLRKAGPYPHYATVRPEFDKVVEHFGQFLADEGLGELAPNQWEVTYVNHIPKGPLWESPAEWRRVLAGLFDTPSASDLARLESCSGEWHFEITPQRGRLHIHASHVGMGSEPRNEALRLVLTARGPVSDKANESKLDRGLSLGEGLDLGRKAIVTTFFSVTTEEAHAYWEVLHDSR